MLDFERNRRTRKYSSGEMTRRVMWNIETSDVKGDFERLKAAGAMVIQEPYAPDTGDAADAPEMSVATFADPDDNYFQLVSPM